MSGGAVRLESKMGESLYRGTRHTNAFDAARESKRCSDD